MREEMTDEVTSTVVDLKKGKGGGGNDGGNQVPDVLAAARKGVREAAKNKAEAKAKEIYGKILEHERSLAQLNEELATVQAELGATYTKHA